MSHPRLVPDEAGQMHGLRGVILWEGLHFSTMTTTPLLGGEPDVPMSWG
jgi:hypothetical protein